MTRLAEVADLLGTEPAVEVIDAALSIGTGCESLLDLLVENGLIERALREARELPEDSLSTRSIALERIAHRLVEEGRLDQALAVAQEIENVLSRHSAIVRVTRELARRGEIDEALAVADRFAEPPPESSMLSPLRFLIVRDAHWSLVERGSFYEALALTEIAALDVRDDLLIDFSTQLAIRGRVEDALALEDLLRDPTRRAEVTDGVVLFHIGRNEWDEAVALIEGLPPVRRDADLVAVASSRAIEGDLGPALETVAAIDGAAQRISGLLRIALYLDPERELSDDEAALLELIIETTTETETTSFEGN